MKLIRTAALSRGHAPPFTAVVDLEVLQLRKVAAWIRWLYLELRMLSDFRTGQLVTSWAVLEALMDCDGTQAFAPSREQLRRAVTELSKLRLLEVYPETNSATKQLFLRVLPIKGFGSRARSADRQADRQADRPRKGQKPSNGAASSQIAPSKPTDLPTDKPTGDSEPSFHTPYPLSDANLSTGAPHQVDQLRARLKDTRNTIARRRGAPLK